MAAITPQQISEAGVADLTLTAAAGGGDTFVHYATLMLLIVNGSGSPITITVSEQLATNTEPTNTIYGSLTKSDATLVVGAGDTGIFGPFAAKSFKDSSGNINVSYSGVTSLTIAGIFI